MEEDDYKVVDESNTNPEENNVVDRLNTSSNVCRICGDLKRKATKSIYSKGRLKGYNQCCNMADILLELTKIKYIQRQNYDELICGECIFFVVKYYVLQQKCLRFHRKIKNNVKSNKKVNLSKFCRCCGKNSEQTYYNIMVHLKTLNHILFELTGIEINDNDLTSSICKKCEKKLIAFEKFRKILENNFNQSQDLNSNTKNILNNVNSIKEANSEKTQKKSEDDFKVNSKLNETIISSTVIPKSDDDSDGELIISEVEISEIEISEVEISEIEISEVEISEVVKENAIKNKTKNANIQNEISDTKIKNTSNGLMKLRDEVNDITDDHKYVDKNSHENFKEINAAKKLLSKLQYKPRKKSSEVDKNRVQKFQCKICNKLLADKRSFRQHLDTHSTAPTFKCADCEEKFQTQKLLESHRKVKHTNEIYKCNLCTRKYLQLNSLRVHVKYTHLGEELPFKCDVCDKRSATKGMLERHRLVHFDTYNFSCDYCSKKFKLKCTWKKHLETHSESRDVNFCKICAKPFTGALALKKHEKSHEEYLPTSSVEVTPVEVKRKRRNNNIKKYSCYLCKDKLRDFNHYEEHIKLFHMHYIDEFNNRRDELINLII